MEVNAAQEYIELRVSVDPAQGDQVISYLGFEHPDFIGHVAVILVALLLGNYQVRDYVIVCFLLAGENGTRLDFDGRI